MAQRIFGAGSAAGADGDWNNPLNWTGDTLPGSTDEAHFDASSPILTTGPTGYTVDKFTMASGASYPDGTVEIRNLTVLSEVTVRANAVFIFTESDYGTGSATFNLNVFDAAIVHADRTSDINMNADLTTFTFDPACSNLSFSAYAGLGQGALLFVKPAVINASAPLRARFKSSNTNFPFSTTASTVYNQVLGKDDWIAQHWTQGSTETINVIRHFMLLNAYNDVNGFLKDIQQVKFEIWSTSGGTLNTKLEESDWIDSFEAFLTGGSFGKNVHLQNDITLTASNTYALVIKGSQGRIKGNIFTNNLDFTSRSSGPSGGKIETSSNAGGSWSLLTNTRFFPMDFEYHVDTQINIDQNGYLDTNATDYDWCIMKKIYINNTNNNKLYFSGGNIDTTQFILDFIEVIGTYAGNLTNITGTLQQLNVLSEISIGGKTILNFNDGSDIVSFPTSCVLKFVGTGMNDRMDEAAFSEYPVYQRYRDNSMCYASTNGSYVVFEDDAVNRTNRGLSGGANSGSPILFKPRTKGSF